MTKYLTFILAILSWSTVYSQNSCPPNIDFELGNLSYWHYYVGNCCPINTPTSTSPVINRHTLTSGTGNDPYGGFPVVSPNGGSYSFRLGNDSAGAQAEKARYYVHVPSGVANYELIYRYAVVLQDGGHSAGQQPRYQIAVNDSATGNPLPCNTFSYVTTSSLPGFTLAPGTTNVYYKSWTTGIINLSGYGGHTMIIDFATGDCALGGHFGYGYLDMSCGLFQISTVQCNLSGYTTLSAPPGYQSYTWKDSTYSTTIATGQTMSILTPSTSTTYKVILTPYSGYGCPDTLTTRIIISSLQVNASNDTAICTNSSVLLHAGASGGIAPLSYSWTPGGSLSCNTCSGPTASPLSNTTYHVTVMDSSGCSRTDSVIVSIIPSASLSSSLSPAAICSSDTFSYVPASTIVNTVFSWNRGVVAGISNTANAGMGSIHESLVNTTSAVVNVTYVYTLSYNGCANTQSVVVSVKPKPVLSSSLNPAAICSNDTFSYTPTSATSFTSFSWSRPVVFGISNQSSYGFGNVHEVLIDTFSIPVNVIYNYTLTASGCVNTQSVSDSVRAKPVLSSSLNPTASCSNAAFSYTPSCASSGAVFNWSRAAVAGISNLAAAGNGGINETLINITSNPLNVTYTYTIGANGCSNTQNVVVSINPKPVLSSSLYPPSICSSDTLNYIPGSATSGTSFNWSRAVVAGISNAAANSTGNVHEALINTGTGQVYVNYVYVLAANGCTDTQNVSVTVKPKPVLSSSLSPNAICSNALFSYTPASATAGTSFSWSRPLVAGVSNAAAYGNGYISESLVNTSTNTVNVIYIYTLTANGCTNTQNVTLPVKINPLSPSIGNNNPVCESDTLQLFANSSSSGVSYNWNGPGPYSSLIQNPFIYPVTVSASGTYYVLISLNGCTDTLSVNITVHPSPGPPIIHINVTPGDTVCVNTNLTFTATPGNAGSPVYQWQKNGSAINGATNAVYATSSLSNGDIINCQINSNLICQDTISAVSNSLQANLISIPPPQTNVSIYPYPFVSGDIVTFTGHVSNGGPGLSYKWTKNGVFIPGATTSTYSNNNVSPTDIICMVTYSSVPCTTPDSSIACAGGTTAIPPSPLKGEPGVWPNPVGDELNIEGAEIGSVVHIYNIVGQEIYTGTINNYLEHVNFAHFSKGSYLLELRNKSGERSIMKMVKE